MNNSFWFLFCLLFSSGISISTNKSLVRKKRSGHFCSLKKLFSMETKDDNTYHINLSTGIVDRLVMSNLDVKDACFGDEETQESLNKIYISNNEEIRRAKRSANLEDDKTYSRQDKLRLVEMLAIQTEQLEHKIKDAADMLDSEQVIANRDLFSMYSVRMRTLLKNKLKLMIKENKLILDSLTDFKIPEKFHR